VLRPLTPPPSLQAVLESVAISHIVCLQSAVAEGIPRQRTRYDALELSDMVSTWIRGGSLEDVKSGNCKVGRMSTMCPCGSRRQEGWALLSAFSG